jgi:hypothetical protein
VETLEDRRGMAGLLFLDPAASPIWVGWVSPMDDLEHQCRALLLDTLLRPSALGCFQGQEAPKPEGVPMYRPAEVGSFLHDGVAAGGAQRRLQGSFQPFPPPCRW